MDRHIFQVYLAKEDSTSEASARLDLPAQPWALLDALDKARYREGEPLYLEIDEYYDYVELAPFLADESANLCELNVLAEQLAGLDDVQKAAFTGLLQMEVNKKEGPLTLHRIWDLAASTDRCHVVSEALNVSQLGRFYAENGFVPEVEGLPDQVFELLDFEAIGRRAVREEGGVFTQYGYVIRHSELKQAPEAPDHIERPGYIFRLAVWDHSHAEEHKIEQVDLPATRERLDQVLKETGAASWENAVFRVEDSAVPGLLEDAESLDDIDQINDLAAVIRGISESGRLPAYKALLKTNGCGDIGSALQLANTLDGYALSPQISSPYDLAKETLTMLLGEAEAQQLLPYVNLHGYGRKRLEGQSIAHTEYGLIARRDGGPIHKIADQPCQGGMKMR